MHTILTIINLLVAGFILLFFGMYLYFTYTKLKEQKQSNNPLLKITIVGISILGGAYLLANMFTGSFLESFLLDPYILPVLVMLCITFFATNLA